MVLTAGALTYYKSQEEYEGNARPRKDVVVPLRQYAVAAGSPPGSSSGALSPSDAEAARRGFY